MAVSTGNRVVPLDKGDDNAAENRAHAMRLVATANELLSIAAKLEMNADGLPPSALTLPSHRPYDDACSSALARNHYRDRRLRSQLFDDQNLFGEPAWDLLLDLFIAATERKQVPVTSACIGAAVPTTTALRWLSILESRGLLVRENDAADARRVFVRLSSDAYAKMAEYFRRSSQGQRLEAAPLSRTNGHADGSGETERTYYLG